MKGRSLLTFDLLITIDFSFKVSLIVVRVTKVTIEFARFTLNFIMMQLRLNVFLADHYIVLLVHYTSP